MIKSPCKGCEKRHMKCHSDCKEYLEFQKENELLRKERLKMSINRSTIFRANNYK